MAVFGAARAFVRQVTNWLRILVALVFLRVGLRIHTAFIAVALKLAHATGNADAYMQVLNVALEPFGKRAEYAPGAGLPSKVGVVGFAQPSGPTQPPADGLKN